MKTASAIMLLALLAAGFCIAADEIGYVWALQGKATATGADKKARVLEVKSAVFMNDRIVTEEGAKVQIRFNDESVVSQGEKSEMVIDEYIYTPADKKNNSVSAEMVNGVFRVVTGKITKLNPERFKVRTKMATIGIRGCDLGFMVGPLQNEVMIIRLHGEDAVTIRADGAKGPAGALTIGESRKLVVVTPAGLTQSRLTAQRLAALVDAVRLPGGIQGDTSRRGPARIPHAAAPQPGAVVEQPDDSAPTPGSEGIGVAAGTPQEGGTYEIQDAAPLATPLTETVQPDNVTTPPQTVDETSLSEVPETQTTETTGMTTEPGPTGPTAPQTQPPIGGGGMPGPQAPSSSVGPGLPYVPVPSHPPPGPPVAPNLPPL